jgi:hypothetical protein
MMWRLLDMLTVVLILLIVFGTVSLAQAEETTVHVFKSAPIQFGDPQDEATWETRDNGRIIRRTLDLPKFDSPVKITARLKLESEGDPWDRFGTVYLVLPDSSPSVELLKFMTGFGTGLPYKRDNIPDHPTVEKWAEFSLWEQDVSHLAGLLSGEVTIEAIIDTWVNPGWMMDFDLIFEEVEETVTPTWVSSIFNTTGEYWTKERFSSEAATITVDIPQGLESVKMFYLTSGHGGRSTGDEFNKKDHVIYIDDKEVLRFVPWREDGPLFRKFSPTSGKWDGDIWSSDLSRSNWIPGDQVRPMIFELDQFLSPGTHTIRFSVEGMAESTPDNLNYWNTSAVLIGYDASPTLPKELKPYLQAPTSNSMTVSWAYNDDFTSIVEYGKTQELESRVMGDSEVIGGDIVWHTVRMEDLEPDTTYYYRICSGSSTSKTYQFTTPPSADSTKAILVGIMGRESEENTEMILSSLKQTVQSKDESLSLILHTGNIVDDGFTAEQYIPKFFEPISTISGEVPVHIVPGQTERDSLYLYQFVHNDHFKEYLPSSPYADTHGRLGEECYQFQLGRTLFAVFNTNKLSLDQLEWLKRIMMMADRNDTVKNIVFLTHNRISAQSSFVQKRIVANLAESSKPKFLIYGDGAGYERGHEAGLEYVSIGYSASADPHFALLTLDPRSGSSTLCVYSVSHDGKVSLIEEKAFSW